MTSVKTAFVLAAGKGERLRPLTLTTPKPLLSARGKVLLDHILGNLVPLGLERVVLNAWYLKDQVLRYAEEAKSRYPFEILVSDEEKLLGTGGGLKRALPLLGLPPFLMLNGDCVFEGDLKSFVEEAAKQIHASSQVQSVWWLTDAHPEQTKILEAEGRVIGIGNLWKDSKADGSELSAREGCFTGIQVVGRVRPTDLPDEGCLIRQYFLEQLNNGAQIGALRTRLSFWSDLGTPERLQEFDRGL